MREKVMFQKTKSQEAIEVYKRYLLTHPTSSRVAFILAQALKENGDYRSAFQYLQQSLNLLASDIGMSEFSRKFIQSNVPKMMAELEAHLK